MDKISNAVIRVMLTNTTDKLTLFVSYKRSTSTEYTFIIVWKNIKKYSDMLCSAELLSLQKLYNTIERLHYKKYLNKT